MRVSSFGGTHGIVISELINAFVDPIGVCVLPIVAVLVSDKQEYENKAGETDGQAGNVNKGVSFILYNIPYNT